jgi:hypothetical protein
LSAPPRPQRSCPCCPRNGCGLTLCPG